MWPHGTGPFRSPSETSQGISNPRHARLKTVAHSGTEKVGGYVVCKVCQWLQPTAQSKMPPWLPELWSRVAKPLPSTDGKV